MVTFTPSWSKIRSPNTWQAKVDEDGLEGFELFVSHRRKSRQKCFTVWRQKHVLLASFPA
jgi:hypothetical protein